MQKRGRAPRRRGMRVTEGTFALAGNADKVRSGVTVRDGGIAARRAAEDSPGSATSIHS